jgi:hypothetical protein
MAIQGVPHFECFLNHTTPLKNQCHQSATVSNEAKGGFVSFDT